MSNFCKDLKIIGFSSKDKKFKSGQNSYFHISSTNNNVGPGA